MTEQANDIKTIEETEEVVQEPAYKKWASYQGALLGGFATLAAALLVLGNMATSETIALRLAEDLQASLSQVISAKLHDNDLLDNRLSIEHEGGEVIVYQAIKNNKATALAYSVSGQGYAGEIKLIMGVSAQGEMLGVRVISHAETPGLGDKMEAEKDDWVFSFNGLSFKKLEEDLWKVKKDGGSFDQFSGATITPRAIVKAVKQGLQMFHLKKVQLLAVELESAIAFPAQTDKQQPPVTEPEPKAAKPDPTKLEPVEPAGAKIPTGKSNE